MGPAVFSNFSITKSLTVDCTGSTGRLFPTVAGIGVQGDGISVVIKGIEILAPIYARSAIEFTQGASLTLEDIEISGGTSVGVKVTAPNAASI